MNDIDKKIEELKHLINTFINDELSLRDLSYLDEQLEEIFNDIREMKNKIIDDRFYRALEDAEKDIDRGF